LEDAVLGAACGTIGLLANLSPNLQSISRAHIRLFAVYPLTAFIRLHALVGRQCALQVASRCLRTDKTLSFALLSFA
jgi:hypothetical protein